MLVSIVVATYNSAKTLERCLESIVPQLGDDCELLVIDGGSKDGTVEIINKYREQIAYTVSEPDKGVYDAWNKAVAKARGKWITFIGSDDMMLPGATDAYRSFFKENGDDFDLVCAKLHFVNEKGELLRDAGEPYNWEKLIHRKWKLAHPGMLHNKRCFEKYGLFDIRYKICGDSDFLQRLGPNTKAGYIDEFLVNMTDGGLSSYYPAIKESCLIRWRNRVISRWEVAFYFTKLTILYWLGKVKRMIINNHR